jgi:hypothetical protein
MGSHISNVRPKPDKVLADIADYVINYKVRSKEAIDTARYCLMDTLGCGFEALEYPACTKMLGPVVQGTTVPNGAKVPGTQFQMDPIKAAFDIGAMIRWLDFNDTWLPAEWGHPSDNLGGILATSHWRTRSTGSASTTSCWSRWLRRRTCPGCWGCHTRKSLTLCRSPGSTASRCARIGMHPTPARARAGLRAMRPAARCGSR